ncbi:2OG-Fe(II) oxygenase [Sneathiella glossodoripedis]|uniref:2OG-Fe(II) oxygenase n=1 Tax=Sneathiella glossodoripedis TaxID=418853 RepID=UPI00046E5FB3|nr:2OG-Fe(II) oxygenase [Sneathiella glossodoripedis]
MNKISMLPLRNSNVSLSMHWQVLAPKECAQIVAQANMSAWNCKLPLGPGNVPVFPDTKEVKAIERQRLPLGKNGYPLDQINFGVCQVNSDAWRFELTGVPADDMPWLSRQKKGNYSEDDWQVDIGPGFTSSRKLSFILQLSDPSSYDGGDVILHNMNTDTQGFRQQGTLIVFPSYWLHRITPVTRGTRHFISGWLHGHSFR